MAELCTAQAPTSEQTAPAPEQVATDEPNLDHEQATAYLATEFPAWTLSVDSTSGWNGKSRELWQAEQAGHHTQRALTPGKLYRRLNDYEERQAQRQNLVAKVR